MEFTSRYDQDRRWEIETPLLDTVDLDQLDDNYLLALATESGAVQDYLTAMGANFDESTDVSFVYSEALGIIASNNLHMWINPNETVVDRESFEAPYCLDNPDFSDRREIQELRRLRVEYPDLFKETAELSAATGKSVTGVFALVKSGASDLEVSEFIARGTVLSWKLGFVTTEIINLLVSRGITQEQLLDLYR
jgi:hypothetical protein